MDRTRPYTWHYLDGYLSGDSQTHPYLREAAGRCRFYRLAPVFLPVHGVLAGNIDKALEHEIVVNRISRHFLQKSRSWMRS